MAPKLKIANINVDNTKNKNLNLFSLKVNFLNLKDNILKLHIIK